MPEGQEEKAWERGGHEGVFWEAGDKTGFAGAFRDRWVMGVGGGRDRIVALGRG